MRAAALLVLTASAVQGSDLYGYHNNKQKFFQPAHSSTFQLVKLGNVNVTFLDKTNLLGYDGQDFVQLGKYSVETRLGMITHCNSANFNDVDGIIGFGWANQNRSAAILKTLTQQGRPHWDIDQPGGFVPMPRKFAFAANEEVGELQLGGYDRSSTLEDMHMFPMAGFAYGVNVTSIKFGSLELLDFDVAHDAYVGEFDSGTTCILLPNSTVNSTFKKSPFEKLLDAQNKGEAHPLIYTIGGREFNIAYEECVEPADKAMILGDPWFRKWIIMHDLEDLKNKKMGLALRNPDYKLGVETDHVTLDGGAAAGPVVAKGEEQQLAQFKPVSKVRAVRKERPLKTALTATMYGGEHVDKVALHSQSRVTYNVKLSVGTHPQPLEVIFDTGSFMLAVFAEAPPPGSKPIMAAEAGAASGHSGAWAGAVRELRWKLQGVDEGLLGAVNVVLLGAFALALVAVTRRWRKRRDNYCELAAVEVGGV